MEKVKISKESIWDDKQTISLEGGPYADGLVVVLPKDKINAKIILEICKRENDPGFEKLKIENNMVYL